MENDDQIILIEKENEETDEEFKYKKWNFCWKKETSPLNIHDQDFYLDRVKTTTLPSLFYGHNRFIFINQSHNLVLEINPIEILDLSTYETRQELYNIANTTDNYYNNILYNPKKIKNIFLNNLNVKNNDFPILTNNSNSIDDNDDWTCSSTYMGTIKRLSDHRIFTKNPDHDRFNNFDFFDVFEVIKIEETNEKIPKNKLLDKKTIILKYIEIPLYENIFDEKSYCLAIFR
jgi:hypothetical protein